MIRMVSNGNWESINLKNKEASNKIIEIFKERSGVSNIVIGPSCDKEIGVIVMEDIEFRKYLGITYYIDKYIGCNVKVYTMRDLNLINRENKIGKSIQDYLEDLEFIRNLVLNGEVVNIR